MANFVSGKGKERFQPLPFISGCLEEYDLEHWKEVPHCIPAGECNFNSSTCLIWYANPYFLYDTQYLNYAAKTQVHLDTTHPHFLAPPPFLPQVALNNTLETVFTAQFPKRIFFQYVCFIVRVNIWFTFWQLSSHAEGLETYSFPALEILGSGLGRVTQYFQKKIH